MFVETVREILARGRLCGAFLEPNYPQRVVPSSVVLLHLLRLNSWNY